MTPELVEQYILIEVRKDGKEGLHSSTRLVVERLKVTRQVASEAMVASLIQPVAAPTAAEEDGCKRMWGQETLRPVDMADFGEDKTHKSVGRRTLAVETAAAWWDKAKVLRIVEAADRQAVLVKGHSGCNRLLLRRVEVSCYRIDIAEREGRRNTCSAVADNIAVAVLLAADEPNMPVVHLEFDHRGPRPETACPAFRPAFLIIDPQVSIELT